MGRKAVRIFWGGDPDVQSEHDFLAQLEGDLLASGLQAIVLANFHTQSGSRQVDFLIATDSHVCHVELKNYESVLEGSPNGNWRSRKADGTTAVIDRQNPYQQAFGCKMALSDDMASLAARDTGIPRPVGGKKFFTQFDSVVCVFPRLAEGSKVPSDYKVQTLGYSDFFTFLTSPGKHPEWGHLHWEAFIRDLGLVNAAGQSVEAVHQTAASALTTEYRQRFDGFHRSGLHELIPLPVLADGVEVAPDELSSLVETAGHLQVIGSSGAGKSHLLKHLLLGVDESVLPIVVDAGMYEGRLSSLIDRSVARFTASATRDLLRAAAVNGQHVLLAVDGFNECPERFREALAGDMTAFCLHTGARTTITTQFRAALPPGLAGAEAYSTDLSDSDRSAVLASYGAEDILPLCGPFSTPYELSIAAECAAELHGPVTRGALFSSFIRKRLSRTSAAAVVRDALRQLALVMDYGLTTWLPIDDVWRISEERLARQAAPVGVIDELLACSLIRTSQGRISFTHEFLGRFLSVEGLRRDHPDPGVLAGELQLPRHGDLPLLAAELETDRERLALLLDGLADPSAYVAALRGKAGRRAERTAMEAASSLLAEVTSGLAVTTFTIAGEFEATRVGGRELGAGECALIAAIGTVAVDGHFTAAICALLDATDAACQRSADEQRRTGACRPSASLIVSAILDPAVVTPGRPREAASILLGAARTMWVMGRIHRPGAEPRVDARVIAAVLDGVTPRSHGRLFLLCYLLRAANRTEAAALVPQVLRLCWASGAYHVQLEGLTMTCSFAAAAEGQPVHEQIVDALSEIDTDHLWLSSALVDALNAYGLIESPDNEDLVREQVSQVLGSHEDEKSRVLAYGIVSSQFEDVIAGPYISVLEDLDTQQRTMLYVQASLGSPHYGFWNDWLLQQLVESQDSRALPAYERWTSTLHTDNPNRQEAIHCYTLAVQGWAQLMPTPPKLRDSGDGAHAAWECYGAIIFWMHRPDITPAELGPQCAPHWQRLRTTLIHAAADPLYWLECARQFSYQHSSSLITMVMDAFPDEMRPIIEWGIDHPSAMESVFPIAHEDRREALIRLLATVGDAASAELLRVHVDDPVLGATAIRAIKALNGR